MGPLTYMRSVVNPKRRYAAHICSFFKRFPSRLRPLVYNSALFLAACSSRFLLHIVANMIWFSHFSVRKPSELVLESCCTLMRSLTHASRVTLAVHMRAVFIMRQDNTMWRTVRHIASVHVTAQFWRSTPTRILTQLGEIGVAVIHHVRSICYTPAVVIVGHWAMLVW